MTEGLVRIRTRFLKELPARRDRVSCLIAQIDDGTCSREDLIEIRQLGHKIAGTSATLGFPKLGLVAAEVDDHLSGCLPVPGDLNQDQLCSIYKLIAVMSEIIKTEK